MRKLLLIAVFLFTITVLFGCVHNVPSVSASNSSSPTPIATPASTPPAETLIPESSEPTETQPEQTAISEFINAQDAGNWDSFVQLWTEEEQLYYRDFFAYLENETQKNGYFAIQSAKFVDTYEVKDFAKLLQDDQIWDLPVDLWGSFDRYEALQQYGDVHVWIVKAEYQLSNEFWDYRNGVNYRILVLVPEDGGWKVTQDYQGYPGTGIYFGDTIQEPQVSETPIPEETPNTLVDGTVHYTDSAAVYFVEVSEGDYVHADIITIDGTKCSYWVSNGCAATL